MRTLLALSLLLAFSLSSTPVVAQGAPSAKGSAKLPSKQFLQDALEKLVKVEETLKNSSKLSRSQQRNAQEEIALARLQIMDFLRELERFSNSQGDGAACKCPGKTDGQDTPAEPVEPVTPPESGTKAQAMSKVDFSTLIVSLKEQAFTDDKLKVLEAAAAQNAFSAAQAVAILEQITFPDSKLEAVRFLAGKIADKENLFLIYKSFVHSSDKDAAKKILEGR